MRAMRSAARFVASFLLLTLDLRPAAAFTVFPEYQTLSVNEANAFDQPLLLDAEYQSDLLAYTPSLAIDASFFRHPSSLALSVGSIASKQFLHNLQFRTERQIAPDLRFRFVHFIQEDFEENIRQSLIEMQWPSDRRWSLAAYGELAREKETIDVGAALLLHPEKEHEIRVFHTWTDVVREQRNLTGDVFVGSQNPSSLGVSGRRFSERHETTNDALPSGPFYLHYVVRLDLPARLRIPQRQYEYDHRQFLAMLEWLAPLKRRFAFEWRAQLDKRHEGRTADIGSTLTRSEHWYRQRQQALAMLNWQPTNGSRIWVKPGLMWVRRDWSTSNGRSLTQRNLLPHVWLEFAGPRRTPGFDQLAIGFEATIFAERDTEMRARGSHLQQQLEGRATFRYQFTLADDTRLTLLASADLDEFGSSHTFEGGCGQFNTSF